jgi:hypothetical protein
MRRRAYILAALTIATTLNGARADRIAKRDGTVLTGTAKQVEGGFEVTAENGTKRFVPSGEISSIKIDNTGKLDEVTARERFESLRRPSTTPCSRRSRGGPTGFAPRSPPATWSPRARSCVTRRRSTRTTCRSST